MISYFLPESGAMVQSQGHPAAGVIGWWNRGTNTSGVDVTEDTALTYSAVWAATRVISETVATLPCIMYRRTGEGKERADDDPRYSLVHDSPNDIMTPYTYFETTTAHMVTWGNEYSKIVSVGGMPSALEIRLPDRVKCEKDGDSLVYVIEELGEEIPANEMLHVAGLGFDGVKGYSVIGKAAQSIGTALASEKHAGSFFGNGAQPAGALVHPQRLDQPARDAFRKSWNEVHQGPENANRIAILHGGMTYEEIGMSNDDAQFLESRQFSVSEIARWFRLPNHLLNDLTHATFSNIEQQTLEFVKYSMTPWLRRWESALNKKLLRTGERRTLFFEFLVDALLRGDLESRYSAFATARQWGWMSVNEIRAKENMNPVDDGDVYLQPMNMNPAGEPVPDTISTAWKENHEKSIKEIIDEARQIRSDLTSGVASTLTEAEERLQRRLSDVHTQQSEMRRDLAEMGKTTQVSVMLPQHLKAAASALVRDGRIASRKREAAAAIKAARGCEFSGENFVGWIESYYEEAGAWLAERIKEPLECLGALQIDTSRAVSEHVTASKDALLTCSDGSKEGFAERVSTLVSDWHKDIQNELSSN